MKQLIQEMAGLFAKGEPFVLATVITRNGSAPRSSGAKMLIRQDGTTTGTVGGGILESQVEQLAREVQRDHHAIVRCFRFTGEDATTMDAICGGQVEVLVEWLDATDPTLVEIFKNLNAAISSHQKTWLVTAIRSDEADHVYALVHKDGMVLGVLPPGLSPEGVIETRQSTLVPLGQKEFFIEPMDIAGTVYIFGAGHVSRSLAEFTKAVGFWTVVLDDRADFACSQRFPTADQLIVLDNFSEALNQIEVDRDSFLVIVTRGHLQDRTVLSQALHTSAGYIGMIGSRRKCGLIFDELRRHGFTDEDIRRVHAPIGLSIDAETPEEIGISILAEMIEVRAKLRE
jgi:xanthine dehydrogenase accessory factor